MRSYTHDSAEPSPRSPPEPPAQRRRADLRRSFHDDEAGAPQMLHKPLGDDLGSALRTRFPPLKRNAQASAPAASAWSTRRNIAKGAASTRSEMRDLTNSAANLA